MYVAGGVAIGVGIGMFISRNQSKTTKSTKPKQLEIAYWTIRGLGAPCRAMVMAADVELIATCYDVLPTAEGGFDRGIYGVQKKQNIKMNPLANLPYVIENGTMITQTNACLQYLGRRLDMMGDTKQEADDCNQVGLIYSLKTPTQLLLTRSNFSSFFRHLLYRHLLYRHLLYRRWIIPTSTRCSLDLLSPSAVTM